MNANALIAAALNIAEETVDETTGLATTSAWDSLAHFRLVLGVEEALGRKLDPVEIVGMSDQQAVVRILDRG